MKDYIRKYQQGNAIQAKDLQDSDDQPQLLSMDAHRSTLPIMGRSSIPQAKVPLKGQGQVIVKNYLTGAPIGVNDLASGVPGTPLVNTPPPNNASVQAYKAPSMREKVKGAMNYIDRDGKNEIAKVVTAPVNSAMNLLRPDKYFAGVHNDSDIGTAIAGMGMDALNVAGAVGGASKILGIVPGVTPEINTARVGWAAEHGDITNAMSMMQDPRSIGERGLDVAHNLYTGREADWMKKAIPGPANALNNTPLTKLRQAYMNNKYMYNAPITEGNLDQFAQQDKMFMRGDGMIAGKVAGQPSEILATKFGDGKLYSDLKAKVFPGTNAPSGSFANPPTHYSLTNDPVVTGDGIGFRANLNVPNKTISNYGYFARRAETDAGDRANLLAAGRFTKNFEGHSPTGYSYDPGSLSGDSFTTFTKGVGRSGQQYVPVEGGDNGLHNFGKWNPFNDMGRNSTLTKNLMENPGEAYLASREMNIKNLDKLDVPEETKNLMMNYFDQVGIPGYFSTPMKKVGAGYIPGEGEGVDWAGMNKKMQDRLQMIQQRNEMNSRTLDDYSSHDDPSAIELSAAERGQYVSDHRGTNADRYRSILDGIRTSTTRDELGVHATRVSGLPDNMTHRIQQAFHARLVELDRQAEATRSTFDY